MDPDRLIARHPTLYHIADARNWDSIRASGLLSTSRLLDRFGLVGPGRAILESGHRPKTVAIPAEGPDPTLGLAYVRDQKPLDPVALAACLDGMTPEGWFRVLNGRVFFWPTLERRDGMLKAYRGAEQAVFEVDTRKLLDRHGDRVELSRINSGFANPAWNNARRGPGTFVPLAACDFKAIAELTVPGAVPDIFEQTNRVATRLGGKETGVLWEP